MNQHLIPPLNFGFVETDLYRSGQPNELNIPFLETLRLKTIIFLSPDEPAPALSNFSQDHGIKFEHVGRQAIFGSSRLLSEEAVLAALQHILQLENYPILICCNLGRHNTGTFLAGGEYRSPAHRRAVSQVRSSGVSASCSAGT
eukprot:m.121286 g.121286  ORF g.121286 m.121286 type:complete len:144 (-) comp9602_c0_seq3:2453-2884(-)